MLLQGKALSEATEDAAEGGTRPSMLLTGLFKVMLGYQRCLPESLAEAKLDATKLLPKVGQADMHELRQSVLLCLPSPREAWPCFLASEPYPGSLNLVVLSSMAA